MAFRVDFAGPGSLQQPERLPDGRIRADGIITRTGVFVYRDSEGGERREYRPPEEVFDEESLRSFQLAPLTSDHPAEMLSIENVRKHRIGQVGETVKRDGEHIAAHMVIEDADTIRRLEQGKDQLSAGYTADIDDKPGVTPGGERYDAVQRNIRANHVAIVDVARAGPSARIRMDDGAVMVADKPAAQVRRDEVRMTTKVRIDGVDFEVPETAAQAIQRQQEKHDAAVAEATSRADKLEAERDSEKARADKAEQARKDAEDGIAEKVSQRLEVITKATRLASKLDASELARMDSDRAIQERALKEANIEIPEGKPDAYVEARFDGALEDAPVAALATVREGAEAPRTDANDSPAITAYEQMVARNRGLAAKEA